MKKALLILCLIFLSSAVSAQKVNLITAEKAAENCYASYFAGGNTSLKAPAYLSFCKINNNDTLLYVFNVGTSGFVIVSAEFSVTPILAFSDEGNLNAAQLSPSIDYWLGTYTDQIEFAKSQNGKTRNSGWNYFLDDNVWSSKKDNPKDVNPLLTTKWDQGSGYNYHCPADPSGPGGKCYAGCVATAMAQVMKYYNFPEHGTGSYSYYHPYYISLSANFDTTYYDWASMSNVLNYSSREAISTLIYHCGVSVNMDYSATGSSASSGSVPYAASKYFGYRPVVNLVSKSDYTPQEWLELLHDNLDEKHPLYYSGSGSAGGHAFVFDGYKDSVFFHINWGWSGSGNGYFTLGNLNPGNGNFSYGQQTVLDFIPSNADYCMQNRILTDKTKMFGDGSGYSYYWNNTQCDWLIQPANADKIALSFTDFHTEENKDFVSIYDGENAQAPLLGVFSGNYQTGDTLLTNIIANSGKMFITFSSDSIKQDLGWEAVYSGLYTDIDELNISDAVYLYPVPAKDVLNIVVSSALKGNAVLSVYNMTGQIVSSQTVDFDKSYFVSTDVSSLKRGIYLIVLNNGKYCIHKKFVK